MSDIQDALIELSKHPLIHDMAYKYRNAVEVSGFLVREPNFIKNDKTGMESCSFLLYQVEHTQKGLMVDIFGCLTFDDNLIKELAKLKGITFLACVGKYRYNKKRNTHYAQISEMKVLYEIDMPLLKKEN